MSSFWQPIPHIAPSIISADLGKLREECQRIEEAGADSIHIDLMDGHFVSNFTLGESTIQVIRRATTLPLDLHLMIYNPFAYIERFAATGVNGITIHFEATEQVKDTLQYIRKCNLQAGLAFSPETACSFLPDYIHECDLLLLMTVHPGFSGQAFLPEMLEKISLARSLCEKTFPIQVDGGINLHTATECFRAGASHFVSGSHLWHQENLQSAIAQMRRSLKESR